MFIMYFKNQGLFLYFWAVLWTKSHYSIPNVNASSNDANSTSTDWNTPCNTTQFKNCSLQENSTTSSQNKAVANASTYLMVHLTSFIDHLTSSGRCEYVQRIKRNEYTVYNHSAVLVQALDKVITSDFYIAIGDGISANQSQGMLLCWKYHHPASEDPCEVKRPIKKLVNVSDLTLNQSNVLAAQTKKKAHRKRRSEIISDICAPANKVTSFKGNKDVSQKDNLILTALTFTFMLLSVVALVMVLATYSLFSELRTPPGINLMNLSASILLSQLLWIAGSKRTENQLACTAIAVLLHYFFLASFVWTSIIAFNTWKTFCGKRRLQKSKMTPIRYMAAGWLSVMVYVSICVSLEKSEVVFIGYGSRDVCWISNSYSSLYFFGIPAGLVIVFNTVLFSLTVKGIRNTRKQTRPATVSNQTESSLHLSTYVRIASLMGFTWVFGFADSFTGLVYLSYVFVVLHSLQGVYIAAAFVFTRRTRKLYMNIFQRKRRGRQSSGATRTSQAD